MQPHQPQNLHCSPKCCICHQTCTSRFTRLSACNEMCTSRFTKFLACHEICTSRLALCLALLVTLPDKIALPKTTSRSPKEAFGRYISKVLKVLKASHVQSSQVPAPAMKSTRAKDHHQVQSAAPVTKSHATNSGLHQVRRCAQHHNESAVEESNRSGPPFCASLRRRIALRRS